ncbi:MAG TPA: hypothetical protein VEQ58_01015 [Polyangiaceae bacterium]|nr:hypothetical protein [Polyangiaceae bacterium]
MKRPTNSILAGTALSEALVVPAPWTAKSRVQPCTSSSSRPGVPIG